MAIKEKTYINKKGEHYAKNLYKFVSVQAIFALLQQILPNTHTRLDMCWLFDYVRPCTADNT
jgi:hypothetical protein